MNALKSILGKFKEVAKSTGDAFLLLLMGFISDLLLLAYQSSNPTWKKASRIIMYAVKEFEPELKEWVTKSDTPYDDKLVDELLETMKAILPSE